jgi:tetratricopeptide (TPR) repeat protein
MIDEALAEIKESIRLRPGWPFYHNKMGILLEEKSDVDGAITEYEEAIGIKPDFTVAIDRLNRIKARKNKNVKRQGAATGTSEPGRSKKAR